MRVVSPRNLLSPTASCILPQVHGEFIVILRAYMFKKNLVEAVLQMPSLDGMLQEHLHLHFHFLSFHSVPECQSLSLWLVIIATCTISSLVTAIFSLLILPRVSSYCFVVELKWWQWFPPVSVHVISSTCCAPHQSIPPKLHLCCSLPLY